MEQLVKYAQILHVLNKVWFALIQEAYQKQLLAIVVVHHPHLIASIGYSLLSALFAIFVHMQVKDQSKRSGSLVISFVNIDRHLITVRTAMTTK